MNSTEMLTVKVFDVDKLPFSIAAHLAWIIVSPLILSFGTFGNVMAIAVLSRLSRKGGQSTFSMYLIALAISDLTLLYSGLLRRWVISQFNYDILATNDFMCKSLKWLIYTSGALSAWLLVAVTLQRAMSVVWPHRVYSLLTFRRSLTIVMCLICMLIVIHAHFVFGWGITVNTSINATVFRECWKLTEGYLNFVDRIWSWADLFLSSILPFAILLTSNTFLLKTVVTSVRVARLRLAVGDTQQVTSREKAVSSMTLTLLVLSFTFVILTGPVCIYLLMAPYIFDDVNVEYKKESVRRFVFAILNLMWYSNSAVNFYLYSLSGSKFRSEFMTLMKCMLFVRQRI